jgi:hypothetical protein
LLPHELHHLTERGSAGTGRGFDIDEFLEIVISCCCA